MGVARYTRDDSCATVLATSYIVLLYLGISPEEVASSVQFVNENDLPQLQIPLEEPPSHTHPRSRRGLVNAKIIAPAVNKKCPVLVDEAYS